MTTIDTNYDKTFLGTEGLPYDTFVELTIARLDHTNAIIFQMRDHIEDVDNTELVATRLNMEEAYLLGIEDTLRFIVTGFRPDEED
jgi:hypothetical protein